MEIPNYEHSNLQIQERNQIFQEVMRWIHLERIPGRYSKTPPL